MALPGALWKPPWSRLVVSPLHRLFKPRHVSRLYPPPFPVINTCPSPTCSCASTPAGLDIDHDKPLSGTMPAYNQHVVICTGAYDWPSRIEDGKRGGLFGTLPFAHHLKRHLGPKGRLHDPFNNVMITNSSFPLDRRVRWGRNWFSSIYFFPRFQYLEVFPNWSLASQAVALVFLSSPRIVDQNAVSEAAFRPLIKEVSEVVILICGHGGRDQRCGVMGPLLGTEFSRILFHRGVDTSGSAGETFPSEYRDDGIVRARVAMVSHIGGHAFAGNVIIYIPPSFAVKGRRSALAGKGIWYGRVEPKHVEGIIEETIFKGRVIADLFRGGIEQGGNILRL